MLNGSSVKDADVVFALRTAFVPPLTTDAAGDHVLVRARQRSAEFEPRILPVGTRVLRVAAAGAVLALVGLLALSILPRYLPSPESRVATIAAGGVLKRALAAVTPNDSSVLHYVVDTYTYRVPAPHVPAGFSFRSGEYVERFESWVDIRDDRSRGSRTVRNADPQRIGIGPEKAEMLLANGVQISLQGPSSGSLLATKNADWSSAQIKDAPRVGLVDEASMWGSPGVELDVSWYREALRQRRVRLEGTQTVDGVRVYRLYVPAGVLSRNVTCTIDVRTSNYAPLQCSWDDEILGGGPNLRTVRIGTLHHVMRFVKMEHVPLSDLPPNTFKLPVPRDVPILDQQQSLGTTDTAHALGSMAQAGQFEPFGVWWLGQSIGGRKLYGELSPDTGSLDLQNSRFPSQSETKPRFDHGSKSWDLQLSGAAPLGGHLLVTARYAKDWRSISNPLDRLWVVCYPHIARAAWLPKADARPNVDGDRRLTVAGHEADLITRKLKSGTAQYLVVDCGDATVMLMAFDWNEADFVRAASGLQELR